MSVAELDAFARTQWEGVLGYMVGSTGIDLSDNSVQLSPGVKKLLEMGRLVEPRGRKVEITQDGFAFILQEVNAQVWTILILYLQNAEAVSHNSEKECNSVDRWAAQHGLCGCPVFPLHAWLSRARSALL